MAGQEQVVGRGHAGGAGADYGDALACPGLRLERQRRLDALFLGRQDDVTGVAVAVADGDRLVHLVAAAVLLARRRADSPKDRREGNRPFEDSCRLAEFALGIGFEEAGDVDVAGAFVLAGRQAVGVVVAEDQLEVRAPQPAHLFGLGLDDHARGGGAGTGDGRTVLTRDLDDAHPARPEAGQLGLIAERRDVDAVVAADLQDRLALNADDLAAIDLELDGRRRERTLRALRGDEPLFGRAVDRCDRVARRLRVGAAVDPACLAVPDRLLAGGGLEASHGRSRCQDRQGSGNDGRRRHGRAREGGRNALAGAKGRFSHETPQETAPAREVAIGWQIPAGQVLRRM